LGQTVTGAITGVVTDPSGAVVVGASVTAENTATAVKTPTQTNGSGVYTIRFLPIGTYTVTIEAKGFNTQKVNAFTLEIDQTAKINISLEIASSTSVEVHADAHPILDTYDATLGNTLTTNEIENIPLNGRNFSSLTLFQAGSIGTDPNGMSGISAVERNNFNSGTASVNGNRQQGNNYMLEGAEDNEPQNGLIGYNPAPDAIAELRVISGNANATYGNASGGEIVTILKSGTNHFHGTLYDLLTNEKLDANTWLANHNGNKQNSYTQNIFGGTFGGPIVPNKLFFFGDYEGIRRHTGGANSISVLTQAMRNGDFSALLPSGIQLYDTQNNFAPYVGNLNVPILNPVATYLFAHPELYPLPNHAPTDGLLAGNFQGSQSNFISTNQEDFKVDWTPGNTNAINGFYSQGKGSDFTTSIIPITFPAHSTYPSKISGASWVHTFSPSIINQFRLGFTRVRWNNGVPSDPSGLFGTNGDQKVGITLPFPQTYAGFTGQNLNNNVSYIGTQANPQVFTDNTFNYSDNLTWQHGRHYLSVGVQATRYQQNYLSTGNVGFLGQFNYSGQYTGLAGGNGYGPADFVLGRIQSVSLADPLSNVGNRQWRLAGYFQDDLKLTSKLTLNLGLRYEYDQPWYEQNNKTANVLPGGIVEYAGHVPALAVPGAKVCPTRSCYDGNYKQFMPRVGFAYQPMNKWVIRGGYGATSFFEGYSFNQRLTSSPPFSLSINNNAVTPSVGNGGTPFTVANAFSQPIGINSSQYSVWPQNTQPAYIHQFTLMVEHAITNQLSLAAGYHGQTGHHLADYRNGNQLTLAQAAIAAPIIQNTGNCDGPFPTAAQGPYFSLVGECGSITLTESQAKMNYNSAQVTLRQRPVHGLEYTLNYTWAKSLTNSSGNYSVSGTSFNGLSVQDGYNLAADYGPSGMDIRHSLNFVGVYHLPFGRGQTFGSSANGFLDAAFGGWKLATTALIYSGFPVTIFGPNASNTNNAGWGLSRANHYRRMIIRNRSLKNWWGTDPSALPCNGPDNGVCAYGAALPGTFGTAANSTERAPGFRQVDLSLFKDIHLWREHTVGFRADFFNAFNIASYQLPDSNITDTNYGNIIDTGNPVRSPNRQIQLGLHYSF